MSEAHWGQVTKRVQRGGDRRQSNVNPPGEIEHRIAKTDRRDRRNRQYATFFLDNHLLGVEVEEVQEVFTAGGMTPVPLAPIVVAGLINLRGQIIMAIDLRKRLGFPARQDGVQAMSVVVRTPYGPVNLLVDQIGDVVEVLPDLFEPPPDNLDALFGSVVEGVYKLEERLLLVICIDALVQVAGNLE